MKTKQLTHKEVINTVKNKEVIVVTENIRTPENVGMLFRISEAFGVKKIFLVGDSPDLNNKKVLRTARNTQKELNITFLEESQLLINSLKKENYTLIGLEQTNTSVNLKEIDFSKDKKIALFIGAERFGIDEKTLENLDTTVHINMFGKNSSINVVNALGICLYEIMR